MWDEIPVHLREGLARYLEHGIPPGHFLTAVLAHDLFDAINRGDELSLAGLVPLVRYIQTNTPTRAHGSRAIVAAWCDAGGMMGPRDPRRDVLHRS